MAFRRLRCAASLVLLVCGHSVCGAERMNVLLLISDDLNNHLGCYGDPLVKTPNIDELASRGVRFDRAYCTFPLCGPSRNSLLTGLYPNSTGILVNDLIFRQTVPDRLSLPQLFRRQGYFAGRIGKMYHYNVPTSIGTSGQDDPASWELQLNPAGVDRIAEHPKIFSLIPGQFSGTLSWYASPASDTEHTDGMIAADAEWVLERCARRPEQPFFLAVGFFRPHTPYVAPRSPWFDLYDLDSVPVVENIPLDQEDLPAPALGSQKKEQVAMTVEQKLEARRAYYACVSFMDAQVGRVVETLDRLGLADNTVIVFTSDHGYHLGEHGLWQKMSLFEESCRIPLIVVVPGSPRQNACKSIVSHVDLFPTLVELCGLERPIGLQGQSLVPMLRDVMAAGRGWSLTQVTRGAPLNYADTLRASHADSHFPDKSARGSAEQRTSTPAREGPSGSVTSFLGYSLRTARWRYTEWGNGQMGRELYDHDNDPRELVNLAGHGSYQQEVTGLAAQLQHAVRSTYPPSGETPQLRSDVWTPLLLAP